MVSKLRVAGRPGKVRPSTKRVCSHWPRKAKVLQLHSRGEAAALLRMAARSVCGSVPCATRTSTPACSNASISSSPAVRTSRNMRSASSASKVCSAGRSAADAQPLTQPPAGHGWRVPPQTWTRLFGSVRASKYLAADDLPCRCKSVPGSKARSTECASDDNGLSATPKPPRKADRWIRWPSCAQMIARHVQRQSPLAKPIAAFAGRVVHRGSHGTYHATWQACVRKIHVQVGTLTQHCR